MKAKPLTQQQRITMTSGKNDNTIYDIYDACPECGNKIKHESGCVICSQCGWSPCKNG